ncbi:MAG: Septum formation initiator [Gaiellaceae bacterium]|nr:Septum formation initiator [Gaiellaceae bacterium]
MIRLRPTRLLALGGITLVAFLYWKPTQTYLHTNHELQARQAEVRELRQEKAQLEKRIAQAGTGGQLVREARRLGLVKPGEKLFIVRGIATWRKHH